MSEDIYGDAYEAFIDEIYKNGGGEPSAVRAAVDCATKSLTAERDALRELLREAAEKLQPISALVDMTPSGFPDHDICPIRLGMARDLRELRARIDAALKGDGDE